MALHIWVAQLNISPPTTAKITSRHAISPGEAENAVVCVSNLDFAWDVDEARGGRAIVSLRIRDRPALLVLYDAGHPLGDVWNLGSVRYLEGRPRWNPGAKPGIR